MPEHSIDGVGTSTAGFAGITERGPESPLLTTSWADYQRWFGGHLPGNVSYLPHAVQGFFENGGQRLFIARITGATEAAYAGGLAALETVDEIALLTVPDEVRFATAITAGPITAAVIAQCERRKDRFGIVSCASGRSDASQLRPPVDTKQAAFYYPWIRVSDALTGRSLRMPPTGHIAGVYARTDIERGVHKAPANEGCGAPLISSFRSRIVRRTSSTRAASTSFATFVRPAAAPRVGRADDVVRLRVEVHQRAPAVHLHRDVDRQGHAVGGVRAERRAALGSVMRPASATFSSASGATAR